MKKFTKWLLKNTMLAEALFFWTLMLVSLGILTFFGVKKAEPCTLCSPQIVLSEYDYKIQEKELPALRKAIITKKETNPFEYEDGYFFEIIYVFKNPTMFQRGAVRVNMETYNSFKVNDVIYTTDNI